MTFQGDEAGPATADVHREAANLVDAVLSAIRDIERVPRLRVIEVERQDLVGLTDIAWRLDRSAESVRLLATGQRGPGGFPAGPNRCAARAESPELSSNSCVTARISPGVTTVGQPA